MGEIGAFIVGFVIVLYVGLCLLKHDYLDGFHYFDDDDEG